MTCANSGLRLGWLTWLRPGAALVASLRKTILYVVNWHEGLSSSRNFDYRR
jgi:hypothetical protein